MSQGNINDTEPNPYEHFYLRAVAVVDQNENGTSARKVVGYGINKKFDVNKLTDPMKYESIGQVVSSILLDIPTKAWKVDFVKDDGGCAYHTYNYKNPEEGYYNSYNALTTRVLQDGGEMYNVIMTHHSGLLKTLAQELKLPHDPQKLLLLNGSSEEPHQPNDKCKVGEEVSVEQNDKPPAKKLKREDSSEIAGGTSPLAGKTKNTANEMQPNNKEFLDKKENMDETRVQDNDGNNKQEGRAQEEQGIGQVVRVKVIECVQGNSFKNGFAENIQKRFCKKEEDWAEEFTRSCIKKVEEVKKELENYRDREVERLCVDAKSDLLSRVNMVTGYIETDEDAKEENKKKEGDDE